MQERPNIRKALLTLAAIGITAVALILILYFVGAETRWGSAVAVLSSVATSMTLALFFAGNNQQKKQGQRK